jgi:hypothetical protein
MAVAFFMCNEKG